MSQTFKNVLQLIIKIGLWIVPFIPLYVSSSLFFPYITGKAFIFRTIVEIILFCWVLLLVYCPEYRPKRSSLLIALTAWIAIVTLASIFGVNPVRSFWSNFERMEGLLMYLHLFAYFLVLSNTFKKADYFVTMNLFVVSGVLENVYALMQRLGYFTSIQGGFRVDGTIGNPTYLAAYLIFIAGFSAFLWLSASNRGAKVFYAASALFSVLIIYFTASRGPVLALIGGGIVASFLYLFLDRTTRIAENMTKKIILGTLIFLIVVPGGIWLMRNTAFVQESPVLGRLTSLSFQEKTITSRFTIWGMSAQAVKEHPLLGWGPENYAVVFSKYYQPELWQQEPWFDRSHNIIFDWLINAGILGLLAYLSIFGSALYVLWRSYKSQRISLELTILISMIFLVYFLQNFFVFDNIATYISFFTFLAFIQSLQAQPVAVAPRQSVLHPAAFAGFLGIPLVLTLYFINLQPLRGNLALLEALKAQNQNYDEAFRWYELALSRSTLGLEEAREQLVRFAVAAGSASKDVDFRDKVLRLGIGEAERSVAENPLDPRTYLFLSTIYSRVGLSDNALSVLQKALELSPKKQQIYFELADAYMQKGDYANAIQTAQKALDLDPAYKLARINLAATYLLNNQQAEADKILIAGYGTADVADNLFVQIYSSQKKYDRLVRTWQTFVKSDEHNLDNWKGLAGAYMLAGNPTQAIAALTKATEINPDFSTEAKGYISQIQNNR